MCSRLSTVQFANGPKRSMGHLLGAKNSFAVRRRTRPQGGRASEILSNRGPEVSLGAPRVATRRAQAPTPHARRLPSVHTYKQGPLRSIALDHDLQKISIQSSLGSSKYGRMRRRRLPDPRPIPEGTREPIYPRKKCAIWTRCRPVPVKNVNYPRAPRNRNSGLIGPHTTPTIVKYKYMPSTPREGYFGPTTLGT